MSKKGKDIEKPWCVYSSFIGPMDFGKIEEDYGNYVYVRYSEGQHYALEAWDSNYVKRFNTLEEAVEDYIKHKPGTDPRDRNITDKEIREFAREKFPSYYKEKLMSRLATVIKSISLKRQHLENQTA